MLLTDIEPRDDSRHRDALRRNLQTTADRRPITRAMQLEIAAWDGESLQIRAPLPPNVNDKGCAFGGSLVSVMTLACR
jgi:thioesterase domain-containing protein